MTSFSLGNASRSLKKPVKGNDTAFSSFGVSGSSLGGASLLLKKLVKDNVTAFPSCDVTRSSLGVEFVAE